MRRLATVIASLGALALARSETARAQAAGPPRLIPGPGATAWGERARDPDVPILFTFSGGISLGAYQAGVNWLVVEFLKRARDAAYRRNHDLPNYHVEGMTGASAGNINVLLASVEYCDVTTLRSPHQSLFWKTWVYTGWNELSPPADRRNALAGDVGVLDRGNVKRHILPDIQNDMNGGNGRNFDPGCSVPLGVIATRVAPGAIGYGAHIRVPNQRFVAQFEMKTTHAKLEVVQPRKEVLADRAVGSQIALQGDAQGIIPPAKVFDVVQASSAYPVAFAPNVVTYVDPECLLAPPVPATCAQPHTESFMDGGVFDNVPVSLAVEAQRMLKPADLRPHVIYVDPSATRGKLESWIDRRAKPQAETHAVGIDALLRFVGGFIPSARSYELQTYVRQQLSPPLANRAWILSSTRGHSVVGEYFNSFAAFFGRPFREFDFYVGVADALQFVTSQILCDPARIPALVNTPVDVSAQLPAENQLYLKETGACFDRELTELLQYGFGLDAAGDETVRRVLHREFASVAVAPVPNDAAHAADYRRARALEAIETATDAMLSDDRPFGCGSGDLAATLLCYDGFDRVISNLARNSRFVAIVDGWAAEAACHPAKGQDYDSEHCMSENLLKDLMHDAHGAAQGIINDALQQLRTAEEQAKNQGRPDHKFAVKTVEFVYRSMDFQGRRGFDLDPSSIPPHDKFAWSLTHVLPFYVGGAVGTTAFQVGWQPTYHIGWRSLALNAPLEAIHAPDRFNGHIDRSSWYGSAAPSIGRDFALPWLNQLSAGARFDINSAVNGVDRGRGPLFERRFPTMPQVSGLFLLNKVRATLYRVPSSVTKDHAKWVGSVSLADVNGLVYWLAR